MDLEVHRRRRDLHAVELLCRLPEPDAARQRRHHSVELWFHPRREPYRTGPEQLKHCLCGGFPQNNAPPLNTKGGVWRSTDSGATLDADHDCARSDAEHRPRRVRRNQAAERQDAHVRGRWNCGITAARFYRSDDVATGSPVFTDLTTTQNINYCTGQCWYDNVVVTPAGYPDTVYIGGSYGYGEYGGMSNSRAVRLLHRRGRVVHGYDLGCHHQSDAARNLLPAQSGCAERHAP